MEQIAGFANVFARAKINQQVNKPFLGKPYFKYGQCLALWGYLFQQGGILGAKHRNRLDAFGHAFLGATGEPGAVERFFTTLSNDMIEKTVKRPMTFSDYVAVDFSRRAGYMGDPTQVFVTHGTDKVPLDEAASLAREYAAQEPQSGQSTPSSSRRCSHFRTPWFPRTSGIVRGRQAWTYQAIKTS